MRFISTPPATNAVTITSPNTSRLITPLRGKGEGGRKLSVRDLLLVFSGQEPERKQKGVSFSVPVFAWGREGTHFVLVFSGRVGLGTPDDVHLRSLDDALSLPPPRHSRSTS